VKGFLKGLIVFVFCVVFLYIIYHHTGRFFHQAGAFNVVEIITAPSFDFVQSRYLDQLVGQNIFGIDLKAVERKVRAEYPAVDRLRIVRRFPNRILVMAEKRDAFVVVACNHQDVAVDEFGVVIGMEVAVKGKLPYLTGLTDVTAVVPGRLLSSQRVPVGIAIVKAIQANESFRNFSGYMIDLTNLSQIHLYLGSMDIVLERFDIQKKINTLGLLLSDSGISLDQISSVDLRFKDPVVKKK